MKKNNFMKVVLVLIVILLAANLFVWSLGNVKNSYAKNSIQYKVVKYPMNREALQSTLNEYANEGWELVTFEAMGTGSIVFKK